MISLSAFLRPGRAVSLSDGHHCAPRVTRDGLQGNGTHLSFLPSFNSFLHLLSRFSVPSTSPGPRGEERTEIGEAPDEAGDTLIAHSLGKEVHHGLWTPCSDSGEESWTSEL